VSVSALAAVLGTALFLAGDPSGPLLVIIDGGSTSYRIVVSAQAPETDLRAAQELQSHLWKISGAVVPVVSDASPPGRDEILVGRSRRYAQAGIDIPWDGLAEDGFVLRTVGRRLVIAGGRDKGSLYGVYAFLEDVLGCRKYTASAMIVPRTSTVAVGPLDKTEVPAFAFREVSLPEAFDDAFADWHKLDNRAARAREWGLWVHTFEVFIPAGKHFETHPEYFTEWNGRRIPHGQLCLSNPDVLRIVIEELGRRIREKPEAKFWSVSQNDAFLPCQCSSCRSLEEEAGGPSGAILWFVNQVARAFPDKVISTLAYQYSRPAPRNIEPEPNVNIMLCSIELNRSRPIGSDPESAAFVQDLRDWRRLTRNILVWDYVVQFRNYAGPFPNLRVLRPNIKLFADFGIPMMFQQGSGKSRSEFHELRTYLIAKLLWNPEADVEDLAEDFVRGFYGPAGPEILRYIRTLHDALDGSGGVLGIYGSPRDGARTYLAPERLDLYEDIFDRAEAAVAGDAELRTRVRAARLPAAFARLEIAKQHLTPDLSIFHRTPAGYELGPGMRARLAEFAEAAAATGFHALDERGLSPERYRADMERYFAEGALTHLAWEKPVTCAVPPSDKYPVGGPSALTDGLKGAEDYDILWASFEGEELEATIDLGEVRPLRSVRTDFLQNINAWIWVPAEVAFSVSSDGVDFREIGLARAKLDPRREGAFVETFAAAAPPGLAARFVRVATKSFLHCPDWHKGAGGKAWIFIDEIVVD